MVQEVSTLKEPRIGAAKGEGPQQVHLSSSLAYQGFNLSEAWRKATRITLT
jgi:hypothetical protein